MNNHPILFNQKNFVMKTNSKKLGTALFVAASVLLFSFSTNKGGDSFEILLNGKRVVQQYVYMMKGLPQVSVSLNSPDDRLDVYYTHCGVTGKERYLTILNERNRALKVWKYNDATNGNAAMVLKLKDIAALEKNGEGLFLSYSSKELPGGRTLAHLDVNSGGITKK
jgi:hypothetical protein